MNKVHYENKKYTFIANLIKNLYQKKAFWNLTSWLVLVATKSLLLTDKLLYCIDMVMTI